MQKACSLSVLSIRKATSPPLRLFNMRLSAIALAARWASLSTAALVPSRRQDSGLYFPVQQATLKNARVGEQYSASVGGLVLGENSADAAFTKVVGGEWVEISAGGRLSGVPGEGDEGANEIEIQATVDAATAATFRVTVPVRGAATPLVDQFSVMSYNLWQGGANVNNYHEKQLRFILESGADLIGFQESVDGGHAMRLGNALGWETSQTNSSAAIISRYPIVEEYDQVRVSRGARISLNGESDSKQEINFWNTHLTAYPYGPYGFCFDNDTPEAVLSIESESGRTSQMIEILEAMSTQLASSNAIPVLLAGDMNAPSHLDYIEPLVEEHCGIADFDWPTSVLPAQAGLIDSYRVAHPDPAAVEGETWSPIYPYNEGVTGDPEPQDRIDFVYATEQLEVVRSETLLAGEPQPYPGHKDNEWTSDHRAVLTHFRFR